MTVQFIAANVFLTKDKIPNSFLEYALRGVFLFLLNGFGLDAGDILPHIDHPFPNVSGKNLD